MISTVTTSTVTTIAALGLTAVVSIVAVVTLIAFLSAKELASANPSPRPQLTARFLNVGILPMIMAFAIIVGVKIAEVLA